MRYIETWGTILHVPLSSARFPDCSSRSKGTEELLVVRSASKNIGGYVRNLGSSLSQTFEPMGIKLNRDVKTSLSQFLTDQIGHLGGGLSDLGSQPSVHLRGGSRLGMV